MTSEERINRGAAAKRLMEDEIMVAAFSAVADGYAAAWANSLPGDSDGRERAYRKLCVLRDVQEDLKAQITDGAMARSKK